MSLSPSYTFKGHGNWSLDATGGTATNGGTIDIAVPDGSHIEKAFLYATTFSGTSSSVTLSGGGKTQVVTGFQSLGATPYLQLIAYRADITDYISQVVGDGDPSQFHVSVTNIDGSNVDGYALAVVYSNPNEAIRTITFLDGYSAQSGDNLSLGFSAPLNTTQPGFQALLSLGIGFGFQTTTSYAQQSLVTVNSRTLSQSAGGSDDGIATNGGLITIGGLGDDPANPGPSLPSSSALGPRYDDELYNLALGDSSNSAPFLANGATSVQIHTQNPSFDDNIFFAGLNITADGFGGLPGFDVLGYPGTNAMEWLKAHTNLGWVGYYLTPAPNRPSASDPNVSWMGKRAELEAQGWKLAPLYVGEQPDDTPQQGLSRAASEAKGVTDGTQAVGELNSEGFSKGTIVYLDIEPGTLNGDEIAYIQSWYSVVSASDFVPGIYSRVDQTSLLANLAPAPLWVVRQYGSSNPDQPATPAMSHDPNGFTSFPVPNPSTSFQPAANGDVYEQQDAVARQYLLNAYQLYARDVQNAKDLTFTVDLDSVLDPAVIKGTIGSETLSGTLSNDYIFGLSGDDVIQGRAGNDHIDGGNGADTMDGGGGGDVLYGGAGKDTITGGAGGDEFIYDRSALADAQASIPVFDRIIDYDQGNSGAYSAAEGDQIDLSAFLSTAYNHGSGQPVGSLVRAVVSGTGADLQIDTDGAANGTHWTTIARLDGIHAGNSINVILDASLPAGSAIAAGGAAAASNFNGDAQSDILLQRSDGLPSVWLMNGKTVADSGLLPNLGPDWHLAGTGDFNGDGKADVLSQRADGLPSISLMDGKTVTDSGMLFNSGANWRFAGTGDFNGDGKADILWQRADGLPSIWLMDGKAVIGSALLFNSGANWKAVGTGDFNGDGKADILLQRADGLPSVWLMNGTTVTNSALLYNGGPDWKAVGMGDFNGDSKTDILLQRADGLPSIWLMNGTTVADSGLLFNGGANWHATGTGDFNADGKSDILLQRDDGLPAEWLMSGKTIADSGLLYNAGPSWHIIAQHDLI